MCYVSVGFHIVNFYIWLLPWCIQCGSKIKIKHVMPEGNEYTRALIKKNRLILETK